MGVEHLAASLARVVVTALLVAACAPVTRTEASRTEAGRTEAGRSAPAPRLVELARSESQEAPPSTTHVALLDPAILAAIESRDLSPAMVGADSPAHTTAELAKIPGFATIFDEITKTIRATAFSQPPARVTSIDGFRLFDERWLRSEEMSFELVGVFNRLDRKVFYEGTCGEIRFVYRLRYDTTQGGAPMASRLPMTLNVVLRVDASTGCAEVARAWQAPVGLSGRELAAWMLQHGALAPAMRERWSLQSVETNVQTIRLQSTVHATLAGHVEYAMRVFHPTDASRTAFAPAPMENMPDVEALLRDASLRADLLAHLRSTEALEALDRGTLALPDRYLTTHATSVAPRGSTRTNNRPFARIFNADDFADLDLGGYQTIQSPRALLRRLDGASCTGCHQSRSIAGFHHVGRDPEDAPAWRSLLSGSSTHLEADLERRRAYVAAVANGARPDEFRPIPERQGIPGVEGAPCGLGDPGFADWTCADGLACLALEDDEIGICASEPGLGSPCELGTPVPHDVPHRERVRAMSRRPCGQQQHCNPNIAGFPLGFCTSSCADVGPDGACAAFLDVDTFQACLRASYPSEICASQYVLDVGVPACNRDHPCRQDYVCARTETQGRGACVPPYFVFPLRLDGYPI